MFRCGDALQQFRPRALGLCAGLGAGACLGLLLFPGAFAPAPCFGLGAFAAAAFGLGAFAPAAFGLACAEGQ